jgi:Flp pilus assembly protein TadB
MLVIATKGAGIFQHTSAVHQSESTGARIKSAPHFRFRSTQTMIIIIIIVIIVIVIILIIIIIIIILITVIMCKILAAQMTLKHRTSIRSAN